MSAKAEAQKKSEAPKPDEKDAFAEVCRGLTPGQMPECCRPMMQMMMSRWMGVVSAPRRP